MVILNEKEYAENCLKTGELDKKPFKTLQILAKYYYHHLGYRKKKIYTLLVEYLSKNYSKYNANITSWNNTIEKIANKAGKYPLYEISEVWLTKAELETIDNIDSKNDLKQLAFTLLCLAKLENIKNPKNNGWVNCDSKEIFNMAHISLSKKNQCKMLGDLGVLKLIEFPKKNENLSDRVTFVNDESEKVLSISDFRELGYEYLKYKGENFIRCHECGILIKNNKTKTKKYCNVCSGYVPIGTKTITCVDCGEEFEVDARLSNKYRCDACQEDYRRNYQKELMRERRKSLKC